MLLQSKNVQKRLKSQVKTVQEADNMSIRVVDYRTMVASINGPPGAPYEDGVITLNISFPDDYPFGCPHITCATMVWHPNINLDSGDICMDILGCQYSPAITIHSFLLSIMSLLCYPNTSDPLNREAALQYTEDPEKFDDEVKKYMSLQLPTSSSNKCISESDISTRLALAWCVWNAGQEGKGTKDNVQWQLDEVMVAILNVHRDTTGRFPEEFDNWSILLKDAKERSTHHKVTLHIDQCQHRADPQNEYVLVYNLPIDGRRVAYIHKQEGATYHCINTLRMDECNLLKIPVDKEGNIIYKISITSTKYDIFSTNHEIRRENQYLVDHWELFLTIAPKQESELEDFCRQMHLLGYYQTCMQRWDMGHFSFMDKLTDLFYRWRRVLRDTTFGFNDGLKLITYMKERLATEYQVQSVTSGASQQQGGAPSCNSCPTKALENFCSSPPTEEEDQGKTNTCTRYALTKCVFNSVRRFAGEEQMLLISQSLISTAVLNILPDCHGSWPEEFDDQLFLTIEKNKEGSMIDVIKFAMHIQLCRSTNYVPDKEYVLVYSNKTTGSIHTVYVEGKEGNSWRCQNSWGKSNSLYIPTDAPGNQLYKVDVQKVKRDKKSFYLRERLGPKALKMFLDNMKENIEPKDTQGLQMYCDSMGNFYHKFEPRWERDHLGWTIRLEEVFEHLWREKYEYFMVQLLISFKHQANYESKVKTVVNNIMTAEENDEHEAKKNEYEKKEEHEEKYVEYEEKDTRFDVSTVTVHPGQSESIDTEVIGLEKSTSELFIDQPSLHTGVDVVDAPNSRVDRPNAEATDEQRGDHSDSAIQLSKTDFPRFS